MLLEMPCWVVDPLPYRVPSDGEGQYFEIERYCLEGTLNTEILQKYVHILLKLNCYYDLYVAEASAEEWMKNPAPEKLAELISRKVKCLNILLSDDTLILLNDSDMAVFHPNEKVLDLIRMLAGAEGLFVWEAADLQHME